MTLLPKHMFFSRGGKLEVEMMRVESVFCVRTNGVLLVALTLDDLDEWQRDALCKLLDTTWEDIVEPDQD